MLLGPRRERWPDRCGAATLRSALIIDIMMNKLRDNVQSLRNMSIIIIYEDRVSGATGNPVLLTWREVRKVQVNRPCCYLGGVGGKVEWGWRRITFMIFYLSTIDPSCCVSVNKRDSGRYYLGSCSPFCGCLKRCLGLDKVRNVHLFCTRCSDGKGFDDGVCYGISTYMKLLWMIR